jgi:excisionase family DNA binding protein
MASNQIETDDELLNYQGASRFLNRPVGTLQVWVCTGRYSLPHYKVGRCVLFKKSELREWLESRKRV